MYFLLKCFESIYFLSHLIGYTVYTVNIQLTTCLVILLLSLLKQSSLIELNIHMSRFEMH